MKICPACSREYPHEHTHCRDDGVALVHLDTRSSERAQDLIGQVVDGRYRVERVVGRGGMGTVYACRHVVVGKAFAMKVLRPGIERSEEILQRFIREAQSANAVQSRHICEMTDFGQLPGGAFYVVMELLHGMSLTRALREQKLKRRDLKHVFVQVAETLEKAHRANIIHRDLKPDNVVLVHDDGDPHFVKLVDFGIAKMLQHRASSLTETGVILGTPYYMSPEQARGDPVDHRSDIYALGVMMYRAFTGRLPFVADTAMGVLTRHLTEKPELPSRITEIDPALERLILRCLEKKPIDRFQTMADVGEAMRAIGDEPVARRQAHPTVDERSPPLKAADAGPVSVATPTRVATPNPRSNAPAMAAAAQAQGYIPPPVPSPATPSMVRSFSPGAAHAATPQPQQSAQPAARYPTPQRGDTPQSGPLGHAQPGPLGHPHPGAPAGHPHPGPAGHPHPGPAGHPHPGGVARVSVSSDQHSLPPGLQSSGPHGVSGPHPWAQSGPHARSGVSGVAGGSGVEAVYGTSGEHGSGQHGGHAGGYDPLQGEAPTNRGLVSSRLQSLRPPPTSSRRVAIGVGVAAVSLCVLAVGAVALYPAQPSTPSASSAAPAATTTPTTANDDGEAAGDAPWSSAAPIPPTDVPPGTSASARTDSGRPRPEPRGATSAAASASARTPGPRPQPDGEETPPPEIRSPFE